MLAPSADPIDSDGEAGLVMMRPRARCLALASLLVLARAEGASAEPRPPSVVAVEPGVIQALAVDAQRVYWTTWHPTLKEGRVCAAPIAGRAATVTVLAERPARPAAIATDADAVYWLNVAPERPRSGQLLRLAKRGGRPLVLASGLDVPRGLVVDRTHLYVASQGTLAEADARPPRGRVQRFAKTGGVPLDLAGPRFFPSSLTSDEAALYFTVKEVLLRVPKAGGRATTLVPASVGCTQPVSAARGLFCWTRASHDGFSENPLADLLSVAGPRAAPEPLLRWQDSGFLAADATSIYISSIHRVGKRELLSLPRGGGLPSLLAFDELAPEEIVVAGRGRLLGIRRGSPSRIVEVATAAPRGLVRALAEEGRARAPRSSALAPAGSPCNAGRRIPGAAIVRLNASPAFAEPTAAALAARHRLRVERRHLYPFLPGFGVRASRAAIEALRRDERVGEVSYVCRSDGGRS